MLNVRVKLLPCFQWITIICFFCKQVKLYRKFQIFKLYNLLLLFQRHVLFVKSIQYTFLLFKQKNKENRTQQKSLCLLPNCGEKVCSTICSALAHKIKEKRKGQHSLNKEGEFENTVRGYLEKQRQNSLLSIFT